MTCSCLTLSSAFVALLLTALLAGAALASEIVGGREVRPHAWPFMVSLQRPSGHYCGANLIAPKFVLSAAHCTENKNLSEIRVVLGAHNVRKQEPTQQVFRIQKVYKPKDNKNDIVGPGGGAAGKLNGSAALNANVGLARLPAQNQGPRVGTRCLVMGWGRLGTTLGSPDVLMEVNMSIVTSWCDENNVCAFQPHRKAGTCYGDSGGPLLCNGVVQGIDSHNYDGCCAGSYPTFFTPVAKFVNWINNTICRNSSAPMHPKDPASRIH